jgi:hypothetical protein
LFPSDKLTQGSADAEPARRLPIRHRGWFTLILVFLSALLCVASAELASRAFWRLRYGVPFRHPSLILYAYYPELRNVATKRPARGDGFYNILLLGGSVLYKDWGEVEQALGEQLAYEGHRNVRIFNLAEPGHTSRDSRLKYAALGQARFDLVVFYHGVNDARTNNAPPDVFREDYSHYSWYQIVNTLAPYHGSASFALPYTLRYLAIRIRYVLTNDRFIATSAPRADWVEYGREPRSAVSFEHNLSAILDLASQRGDRVLLMTFATYVPENYSLKAFTEKRLDYGLHRKPIETWGRREYVLKAVAAQNEIVRSLAAKHEGVLFVDQAKLMAGSPRYFNDPCHFTVVGSSQFVENLLDVVRPILPSR